MKLAKESGNKLTQMLAKDGETLVDAKPKDSTGAEGSEGEGEGDDDGAGVGGGIWNHVDESSSISMTVEDMRAELFEGEDVVMDKNSDHGLSRLTGAGGATDTARDV
jgi:hypothetical protein